jgi:hypothetical protein
MTENARQPARLASELKLSVVKSSSRASQTYTPLE